MHLTWCCGCRVKTRDEVLFTLLQVRVCVCGLLLGCIEHESKEWNLTWMDGVLLLCTCRAAACAECTHAG